MRGYVHEVYLNGGVQRAIDFAYSKVISDIPMMIIVQAIKIISRNILYAATGFYWSRQR